jgi:hypothetical protein
MVTAPLNSRRMVPTCRHIAKQETKLLGRSNARTRNSTRNSWGIEYVNFVGTSIITGRSVRPDWPNSLDSRDRESVLWRGGWPVSYASTNWYG